MFDTTDATPAILAAAAGKRATAGTRLSRTVTGVRVGRTPAGPERLPLRDWVAAAKRAFKEFVADDCMGLAQQIAYSALLAFFPAAVFFGAPYSESLFLLLAVGAFYAARTGRWAWAGACAGLASGTRSAGLLLLLILQSAAVLGFGVRMQHIPPPSQGRNSGLA